MTYEMAQDNRRKALKDITDHLDLIQAEANDQLRRVAYE